MLGSTLALLSRSLFVELRRVWTHVARIVFAFVAFFMMFIAQVSSLSFGAPGLRFFTMISWLNFFAITIAGASVFATAITEEKDESTLGLLKMAGIGPVALMLGKSTSRLLLALMILVVQLPFTLLAVTLGGVTATQVLATYGALAAWTILLANIGLFCSVVGRSSAWASALAVVILFVVFAVPPIARGFVPPAWAASGASLPIGTRAVMWIGAADITLRMGEILTTGFGETLFESFLSPQALLSLVFSAALFGLSWLVFERYTSDRAALSLPAFLGRFRVGRGWLRPGRVKELPMAWKDFHFVGGGWTWAIAKVVTIAAVFVFLVLIPTARDLRATHDAAMLTAGVATIIGAIELALLAGRVFRVETNEKTLSTLLMLPRSTASIARGKALGILGVAAPTTVCAALALLIAFATMNSTDFNGWYPGVPIGFVVSLVGFFVFLHFVAYLSLLVKWGALPLALVLTLFISYCAGIPLAIVGVIFSGIGNETAMMLVVTVGMVAGGFALCAFLQKAIISRLEELASQ